MLNKYFGPLTGRMASDKAADASTRIFLRQFEYIILILYDWICRLRLVSAFIKRNRHALACDIENSRP